MRRRRIHQGREASIWHRIKRRSLLLDPSRRPRDSAWPWVALLLITALAAFLRLHRIDRIPPGDGYDPAFYGLDALEILDGARPVFLETNFGREVMFSYLVAASFALLGAGTTAIHLTSAIVGILTIPAVYLVAREIFATDNDLPAEAGGLLAALTIAVSYTHLSWSRYGVRAILVPLFAALTVYLLWRGLRARESWAFAACGLCLGLSLYTYQAAWALPLLALFGYWVWRGQRNARRRVTDLLLVAGTALLIFAPLGRYMLNHPGSLTVRANQVAVWNAPTGEQLPAILARLGKAVLLFSLQGDTHVYSNIPGRPALNPFLSLAFHAGIVISLWRIRRPPYALLLAWLGLMCAPAILAQSGPVTKRLIGAWPAVAMLVAIGLLVPYRRIRRWIDKRGGPVRRALGTIALAALGAGFASTGVATYRDYFVTWAQDPHLPLHFDAGLSAIGTYIGGLPEAEQVYLSPTPPEHPTIVLRAQRREDVTGYNGRVCLVLPSGSASGTTYVIVPGEDKNSLSMLRTIFPDGDVIAEGPRYLGQPYFLAYGIPGATEPLVTPNHTLEATWRDGIALLGYDLDDAGYEAGDTIRLTLYYQSLSPVDANYTAFVHLLGPPNPAAGSPIWGQVDAEPCAYCYPTSHWEKGQFVIDHLEIAIPADAPPGAYNLAIGFYQWPTLDRLPVSRVEGQVATDHIITLDTIQVRQP